MDAWMMMVVLYTFGQKRLCHGWTGLDAGWLQLKKLLLLLTDAVVERV